MSEASAVGCVAEVATIGGQGRTLSYAVPDALVEGTVQGRRVLVPVGAAKRTGVVVGVSASVAAGGLRAVASLLDDGPLVSPEVLRLASWAAGYYAAPLGLALKPALPPGAEADETLTPVLSEAGRQALATGSASDTTRRALRAVASGESQVLAPGAVRRLVKEGLLTLDRDLRVGGGAPLVDRVRAGEGLATASFKRSPVQAAIAGLLLKEGAATLGSLSERVPGARDAVARLAGRGLVVVDAVPYLAVADAVAKAEGHVHGESVTPPPPTRHQREAGDRLETLLADEGRRPVLLEGVTGSGKTEVYLRLIAAARGRDRGAIVLVPEIALTPQLAGRFRRRFGSSVAVLHSGLTDRDRAAEWHRIRRGEAPIVVGARSAVFCPLPRVGVIVVDEEHDGSFKQGEGLRYNGRDLAIVRAKDAGALVVLGSATPSLESLHNAHGGRYEHLRLPERVDARPMPTVALVDLRGRARDKAVESVLPSGLLGPAVVAALRETVERREQAIVFLNRRGHSTAILCRDCGDVRRCGQCAVAMTWHERARKLTCHYCGAREPAPSTCANCDSARLLFSGAGTEKLEEELAASVPDLRIARLDRDTAGTAKQVESVLGRFSRGEADVLVGTQMVAKGHDFPGVTLVCVLLADAGLHQPDFRAAERTAQLLTQVAGRAGRGDKPGRVLVQTYAPDAAAIQAVVGHDYARFAASELEERRLANYPPFTRAVLIRVESEDEAEANAGARVIADAVRSPDVELLGPAPSSLPRLRGRHRVQLFLKAPRHGALRAAIDRALAAAPVRSSLRVVVDVDPLDLV